MTAEQAIIYVAFPLAGYVLGSIPFAWVIGKFKGVDIRTVGSKNIGATNLGRTLGAKFFWYAFLLDAAKGFVPVLVAALLTRRGYYIEIGPDLQPYSSPNLHAVWGLAHRSFPMWAPLLTAMGCMLGHLFPIWLKFKGGKGVATGFGVVLGFWPLYTVAGLIGGAFFVFMLMVYRYISLASMTSALLFACVVAMLGSITNPYTGDFFFLRGTDRWVLIIVAGLFAALIIVRHRTNIGRLLKGTESQIGQREVDKAKIDPLPKMNEQIGPKYSKGIRPYTQPELEAMNWPDLLSVAHVLGVAVAGKPRLIEDILEKQSSRRASEKSMIQREGVADDPTSETEPASGKSQEGRAPVPNDSGDRSEGLALFERARGQILQETPELADIRYAEAQTESQRRLIAEALAVSGTHIHFYTPLEKTGQRGNLGGFILRPHAFHAFVDITSPEDWQLRTAYEEVAHDLFTRDGPEAKALRDALGDPADVVSRFLQYFPSYGNMPHDILLEEVIAHAMGDFRLRRLPAYLSFEQAQRLSEAFRYALTPRDAPQNE